MTLEEWLKEGEVSLSDVARAIGTSRQAVHGWVIGRVKPRIYYILALEVLSGGKVTPQSWLSPVQALALKGLEVASGGPGRE